MTIVSGCSNSMSWPLPARYKVPRLDGGGYLFLLLDPCARIVRRPGSGNDREWQFRIGETQERNAEERSRNSHEGSLPCLTDAVIVTQAA